MGRPSYRQVYANVPAAVVLNTAALVLGSAFK
jgi:hypothetical protein